MRRLRNLAVAGVLSLALLIGLALVFREQWMSLLGVNPDTGPGGIATLTVPAGYEASVFATGLRGPRFMALAPNGTLVVAERGADRVVALLDDDADGEADASVVVASGFGGVNSVAFDPNGRLLVAADTQLLRLTLDGDLVEASRDVVVDGLPGGGHATKTVLPLPDGRLLLSIGSSCNVCIEADARRASVQLVTDDGVLRPWAVGLRNAVGLWLDDATGDAWATVMGRDLLGDGQPPETVYRLTDGLDAGWPRCHAGHLPDPEFGRDAAACDGVAVPSIELPAHTAPLALVGWEGHLAIALHGSWNSSTKVGYRVVWVPWDDGPTGPATDLATGFLPVGAAEALGRPAGLVVGGDGALYISDDKSGYVYRVAAID
jgi:glucose/arabinose dehydrogenase